MKTPKHLWVTCTQCSTTLTAKSIFLCLSGISCVSICAHCLLCFQWAPLRRVWLRLLYSPHQVFMHTGKIPLSLLFSRLNSPSTLSFCLYVRCSKPSVILMALSWPCPNMSMSLLYWGAQSWTQYSRCLTSAEWRGRITSLDLLAALLLMQPRMLMKNCSGTVLQHFPSSKTTILILLFFFILLINPAVRNSSNKRFFLLNFKA